MRASSTYEKLFAREARGWYIWAAASAAILVADVVLHGLAGLDIFLAMFSMAFAGLVFSGRRAEDLVIARYQERPPRVGRTTTMTLATRVAILRLVEKSLWGLWFVLLASSLMFRMTGNLKMSWAVPEWMIALVLVMTPVRVFIAAALFR